MWVVMVSAGRRQQGADGAGLAMGHSWSSLRLRVTKVPKQGRTQLGQVLGSWRWGSGMLRQAVSDGSCSP